MMKKVQLPLQTLNLVVGFMVWVIISALLPFMREEISIDPEKVAIVTAVPVVLGSVLRIPLGYYANVFGARIVFLVSFILLLFPVYYISVATSLTVLILGGSFLGLSGLVFLVCVSCFPIYITHNIKYGRNISCSFKISFFNRCYISAEILSERKARLSKWYLRHGKRWDSDYDFCCPSSCCKIRLANDGKTVHTPTSVLYTIKRIFR